jgi:uncharacterized membrane protein
MKAKALLLVVLLLVGILPAAVAVAAADGEDRQSGVIRVKLYAQLSTTEAFLNTEQSSTNTRTTDSIDFTSSELDESLDVRGVDTGVGQNKGLQVRLGVANFGLQSARVTVQIRDDDNVIANKSLNVPTGETRWDWRLPFTATKDTHTFSKRHQITLRVTADKNVFVRTDSDSYLELWCIDHLHVDVETRDVDDRRSTSFYPNDLPDRRHVMIEGDILNPFGSSDVAGVNVSIKRPNGQYVVEEASATVGSDLNYTYDWNYASGLPSGTYSLNITARDMQGHEFSTLGSFMMAQYGVRLSAEGEEAGRVTKSTTSGTPAKYTLTVLNIGGMSAQVTMDEGTPVPLWVTSFSKSTFNLAAGSDDDVTFDVKPSATLGGGNQSVFTVSVEVTNDPLTPKAKDVLEVETFVRDVAAFVVLPENPDPKTVGVDGTVDHAFTLRNMGEETTTVDLTKTGVPQGWIAEFTGPRITDGTITDLRSMEIVDIVLKVTAPTTSTVKKAIIKVRCQSREYIDVFKEITFETNLVIGLRLTPTTPLSTTQDPGGSFVLYFEAYNNDPTSSHAVTFSVDQKTSSWPSSTSFRFTPSTLVNIDPERTFDLGLEVNVPTTAEAGSHRFTVKGVVDNNDDVSSSFDFNVTINVRHELVAILDPSQPEVTISTGEERFVFLTIRNDGNVAESVNITVAVDSEDVKVRINEALTSIILSMRVEPGSSTELKISFEAGEDATHNDEFTVRISVSRAGDTTPIHPNDFKLIVDKSSGERFQDFLFTFWIMIVLLGMMVYLVFYKPRSRQPVKEKEEEGGDSHHGTVVRH